MFTFINPKVEYPISKLIGFDFKNISLDTISVPSIGSSLSFASPFKKGRSNELILTKNDVDIPNVNVTEFISVQAKEMELLLWKQEITMAVKPALVHLLNNDSLSFFKSNSFTVLDDKYVFFKSQPDVQPIGLKECIFELQVQNLTPVLVCPERISYFNSHVDRLSRLRNRGVVFQIDWLSLTGLHGSDAQKAAIYMLESKSVEFIGFDHADISLILNGGLKVSKKIASLLDEQV